MQDTTPILHFLRSNRIDPATFNLLNKTKAELLDFCSSRQIELPTSIVRDRTVSSWKNPTNQVLKISLFLNPRSYLNYEIAAGETVEILAEYDHAVASIAPQLVLEDE